MSHIDREPVFTGLEEELQAELDAALNESSQIERDPVLTGLEPDAPKHPTTKAFFNLSVGFDYNPADDISDVMSEFKDAMEMYFHMRNLGVFHIDWDRQAALDFVRARSVQTPAGSPEVRVESLDRFAPNVARVLEQFNLTLPKQKKGDPDWRIPKGHCHGQVAGLDSMRGKVILTNGIIAILVQDNHRTSRNKCHWMQIHWDWFIPDDVMDIPEGVKAPKGENSSTKRKGKDKAKAKAKVPEVFSGF